ncbi:YDG domain-containing protein [Aquincola tertiaricarbonis]|uniref:YDG domain-containing protein n=1 Tax=Aquincola tertiaricarbonis TaxID=391953 RepID=A0ABY4SCM7_AQUTE|nr:YDG domain-containing protein [Aquincola tertiaricarbonis]URI10759.1 YDG domain-containing protein [Aquincola tertiaricarbonis]
MRSTSPRKPARRPQPHPLAAALALCLAGPAAPQAQAQAQAQALPSGLQVMQGQAAVDTAGGRMTITNSHNAILNWRSFSIGAQQSVHFNQASSASQVLNRVTGTDPSSILGSLSSNGKVWLLNPHGVLFGAGARVDVAGLVVSTLNLADADFLAGRYRLGPAAEALAGEGRIVNQGELRTASGGRVALLASAAGVANEGLIEAPGGQVLLAAGQQIELVDTQAPNLALRVTAPAGEALNLGRVIAPSGRIDVQAAIVNQQGVMRADALAVGPGGELVLQATQQVNLAAGSQTTAQGGAGGGPGGRITLDAGPQGTALVAGSAAVTSPQGTGGTLQLLGRQVGVLDGGVLDASGRTGGGQLLVGGGAQGADPALRNAQAAYIAPQATLAADATGLGDGGQVVVWSDQATRAYGRFSALGGPLGGHGGLVETSGGWLDARPASVRVQAPRGRAGTWLLDPNDITIVPGSGDTNIGSGPDFSSTDDGAQISATTIESALQAGNNVSITTGTGGNDSQAGDILMQNVTISPVLSTPVTLTLNAHNHIQLRDSSVSASGVALGITLNAAKDGGTGSIFVSNTTLDSNGGNIVLGGGGIASGPQGSAGFSAAVGADPDFPSGIHLRSNSLLQAGNGSITLRGATVEEGSFNAGVLVEDNSSVQARDIVVQGWSNGGLLRTGVHLSSGTLIATHSLRVEGTALAATDPGGSNPSNPSLVAGVLVNEAQLIVQPPAADSSASLAVQGTATLSGSASAGGRAVLGFGVSLARNGIGASGGQLRATNGASLSVEGTLDSADGGYALLVAASDYGGDIIDAAGASSLTLTANGAGQRLGISGGNVVTPTGGPATIVSAGGIDMVDESGGFSASINGGASSLLMQAQDDLLLTGGSAVNFSGSNTAVTLQSTAGSIGLSGAPFVASGGTVRLLAPEVSIAGSSTLSADASGDALVVAGSGGANVTRFQHTAASPAFNTPNGRWLVYATEPDNGDFDAGSLVHDFRQYDAVYGRAPTVLGSGNGLLFSVAPTLALSGAVSKVYDGNTTVLLSAAEVQAGTGNLAGDTVTVGSGAGTYADAHVGSNKAVTVNPSLITATDASGKPVYGYRLGAVTGEITPRSLSVAGLQVADKVYDGLTDASVSSSGLVGLVPGENLQLRLDGRFSDANAGTGKAVAVAIGLADGAAGTGGSGLASDYVLATTSASATASITPRPLTLAAVADGKTYDGSDAATVRLSTISGLVSGEQLTLGVSGRFSDANAGSGKTVQVAVSAADGSGGRLANYQVPGTLATTADIDLRTLTYTATPVSLPAGSTLPGFTGQVGGFIEGENLANATTGTLRFSSPATNASPAGSYAIEGGGLAALNYRFQQAAANATALTLLPVTVPPPAPPPAPIAEATAPLQQSTPVELAVALATLLPEPTLPTPLANRTLDATQALAPQTAATGSSPRFGTVQVGAMSQDALAALLASRDRLKQQIFAQALAELAARPQAADVPACATPAQAETGLCMITVKQRDEIRAARQARLQQAGGVEADNAPSPAPAPAAAPGVSPPPAPAQVQRPEAAPPLFPVRAAVRSAALPQIQRKLAVLIGTDRYSDSRIPQLDNAARDARAVAAMLQSSLGYETLVIENGSKDTVMRTLNRLATEVGPNDSVVLYYAGHGAVVPTTGEGYWQPADADANRPETWISNADIGRAVERLGATQVALISDSCYSGTLVSDARIRATTAALDPTQVLSRRTAVVMSSGGNEPVFDAGKEGHSTFAWNLMRTLQQVPTWQPGGNVFERVRFAVARELPQRPQYGAFSNSGYAAGADYLFEKRELTR